MQCKKTNTIADTPTQPDGLPPETQEGKNTFGCFWNDTLWLPSPYPGIAAIHCTFNSDSNWTSLAITNKKREEAISFNLKSVTQGYNLYYNKYPNSIEISKSSPTFAQYSCDPINGLVINITKFVKPNKISIPNTKGILSGTFSGKFFRIPPRGQEVDTNDFIIIKKAVFDLQVN